MAVDKRSIPNFNLSFVYLDFLCVFASTMIVLHWAVGGLQAARPKRHSAKANKTKRKDKLFTALVLSLSHFERNTTLSLPLFLFRPSTHGSMRTDPIVNAFSNSNVVYESKI